MPHLMIHDPAMLIGVDSRGPGNGPLARNIDLSEEAPVTSLKSFNSLHAHLKNRDPR